MPNVHELIRDHVTLSIRCLDRLYLHAYLPKLQTSGGLCYFLRDHLGHPIPSPALFAPMLDRFVGAIKTYATTQDVPLIAFERGQRKDDVVTAPRASAAGRRRGRGRRGARKDAGVQGAEAIGPPGRRHVRLLAAIGRRQSLLLLRPGSGMGTGVPEVWDLLYVPYPIKLCLNGHEWVKQQLRRADIAFDSLDNGFLACADPTRLQAICDHLGPADVQAFFDRWTARLPAPLTAADRAAGYTHRLALQQVEVSLTQVFARPVQGRHFFEAVIRENLDLGRPDRVGLLFPHRITRRTPPPTWGYRTRVITEGVEPSLHIEYKSSHVKQYFKEQRALRTETTINNPTDFYVAKAVPNLSHLRDLGDQLNHKLLEVERVSHQCVLTQDALDRLQRPTVEAGQRTSALRFGDPRVMALFQAITAFTHLPRGFRNRDLRPQVDALLGRPYSTAQMTYDLRRLRLKGLIHRIPTTHRYTATSYGLKVAFFSAKLYLRILRPAWPALLPADDPLPRPLRAALDTLDAEIRKIHEETVLAA